MSEYPIARSTDPITLHQRLFNPGAVDITALMTLIRAKYQDRLTDELGDGCCTDDDIAAWIGQPRNIAAKVRIRMERKGLLFRVADQNNTYTKLVNQRAQWVMCYAPTIG